MYKRYSYLDYFIGTLMFFGSLCIVIGGAVGLSIYVHWAAAIIWGVISFSAFVALLLKASDHG